MTDANIPLHIQVFRDTPIGWGSKYPRETALQEIWETDSEYLLWAANLKPDRPNRHPLPTLQNSLVRLVSELRVLSQEEQDAKLQELAGWRMLAHEGEGIARLPRPSKDDCQRIIANATIVGAHSDLDGIYSAAAAIAAGGALSLGKMPGAFHRIRLFRYGFRGLQEYSEALFGEYQRENECCAVVIDFAAHPDATLNLDHHATALSYWAFASPLPQGVYDPTFPSCPRLLSECCGLQIPEEVLVGCDLVDGAQYRSVEQTLDFSNPFVALEFALQVDVSELIAKKAVLTLADSGLDPQSLLSQAVWRTRVELVRHEADEQRAYWEKKSRFQIHHDILAVADARMAPYSASRFRYMPFENEEVANTPYLLTIRPKSSTHFNLGISRNPFYPSPELFEQKPRNLGALAKQLGEGGGRREASAVTIEQHALPAVIERTLAFLTEGPLP